jgi:replicative DNA helicase
MVSSGSGDGPEDFLGQRPDPGVSLDWMNSNHNTPSEYKKRSQYESSRGQTRGESRGESRGPGYVLGTQSLPHNLEAERSVLGAVLVRNDALDMLQEIGLEASDFYRESHRKIFEAAQHLSEKQEPIDLVTLSSILRGRGTYDLVGGTATLTGLFDDAFAVGNVSHYGRMVREKALQRRMIETCSEIISNAIDGVEDTDQFIDESESKVFAVTEQKQNEGFVDLKSILMGNMATIEELALNDQDVTGLGSGFTALDKMTTGFHPGQTIILAARPGMGKTSWITSAIQHAAVRNQSVVAFFSLEMGKEELGFRFLSGLSRIDSRRLKVGKLSTGDWHRLAEAADYLSKARLFIDDGGSLSVLDIRARCRRLLAREKKLDMIVIDYLQLMRGTKASQKGETSREREISEISRGLKQLAKELKVPIIALSQLNRGVETRQDKRPGLSDLRESGAIEQDADIVCFIHREDYYNKDTEDKGIAEIIIAKNRAGETGTVRLAWLGQYTLFANLAEDQPGQPVSGGRPDKGDITL